MPTFVLANGSTEERRLRNRLRTILEKHNRSQAWEFTNKVLIDHGATSHSHPVLTIGTNSPSVNTNDGLLSVFLHEQLHWYLSRHPVRLNRALAELKVSYPRVRVGSSKGGARNEKSTYLHLLVCLLEYDALSELLPARARTVIESKTYYKWIYRVVLSDHDQIESILAKNHLFPVGEHKSRAEAR